jgi:PGF-pre-PGF domain-containing protein
MTGTNVKVNEILANPQFRNIAHLIGTLCLGYILMRLLLYALDATQIGIGWLEANQDSSLLIIILVLIFIISFLIIDACLSLGRRRLGDMKYSAVENGISLARVGIRRSDEIPGLVKRGISLAKTSIQRSDELPGIVKEKARIVTSTILKIGSLKGKVHQKNPARKEIPIPQRIKIATHTEPEPEFNIMFSESVQILLKEGKRVIKVFDSKHSITVIDFKSRITENDANITIELLKEKSEISEQIRKGLVYEFDNIWLNVPDDAIDKAYIRFKIDRKWITQNKIQNVHLEQFFGGKWDILTAKGIGLDAKYRFYEVYVPYLSVHFAIVGT